ncbi:hypothetical protein OXX79_013872, partial [Metschnikowia pulcherrima]
LGPISYLYLGKADKDSLDLDPISLLDKFLPVYKSLLAELYKAGAKTVQIDEPILVLDLPQSVQDLYQSTFQQLVGEGLPEITLTTYFGDVRPNLAALKGLPVKGFHFDFTRAPAQFDDVLAIVGDNQTFSVGVVDGRNIW